MKIAYSTHYFKAFKKLEKREQELAVKRLALFQKDPFNPNLKTHKLTGSLGEYWSFSINYSLRVMFIFTRADLVTLIDVGTHEIYK